MSERAQALEAIRARLRNLETTKRAADRAGWTPTALAYYVEDVTTLLGLVAAPPVGVSPQPDDSTPDMGHGWFVTVGRWGDSIVTIEEKCLSGKPDFTAEDQALVRGAARHLLAFIGQPASVSPVEPTPPREMPTPWARRQPGEWIPTAECECERCAGAREREAGRDDDAPTQSMRIDPTPFVDTPVKQAKRRAFDNPTVANLDALIDVALASGAAPLRRALERIRATVQGVSPAAAINAAAEVWSISRDALSPVESTPSREPLTGAELLDRFRPVEPTPELPRDDFTAPLPPRPPAVVKPQRYDLVRYGVTWEGQDNQPLLTPMPDGYWTPWHLAVEPPSVEPAPPTPAPCVWREDAVRAYHPACWTEASHDHHEIYQWEFCPYCGHPLQITR